MKWIYISSILLWHTPFYRLENQAKCSTVPTIQVLNVLFIKVFQFRFPFVFLLNYHYLFDFNDGTVINLVLETSVLNYVRIKPVGGSI